YSSNSGVCPGSIHPPGEDMRAMLAASVCVFTRPTYSRMTFGLLPAAAICVGCAINVGIGDTYGSDHSPVAEFARTRFHDVLVERNSCEFSDGPARPS